MKTVLAVWNSGSTGKTSTLREFANLLLRSFPNHRPVVPIPSNVPAGGDFRLVIDIDGVIIGVESQGDPGTKLKERLLDLADTYNCKIILCSTRTRGDTVSAVENLHTNRGFQMVSGRLFHTS